MGYESDLAARQAVLWPLQCCALREEALRADGLPGPAPRAFRLGAASPRHTLPLG